MKLSNRQRKKLGHYLKSLRLERKLTLEKTAEEMGFSVAFLHQVENGNSGASRDFLLSAFQTYKPDRNDFLVTIQQCYADSVLEALT